MPENESVITIALAEPIQRRQVGDAFRRHARQQRLPWMIRTTDEDLLQVASQDHDLLIFGKLGRGKCQSTKSLCLAADYPGPSLWFNDAAVGQEAAVHLYEEGWRHAVILSKDHVSEMRSCREAAFSTAFLRLGGMVERVDTTPLAQPALLAARLRELCQSDAPPVFFAFQDRQAAWLLERLRALDLRIPDQAGLIGCEDTPLAAACDPPLSSVRTSWNLLGTAAARAAQVYLSTGAWPPLPAVPPIGVAVRGTTRLTHCGDALVERLLTLVRRGQPSSPTVADLASQLDCSPRSLLRRCTAALGCGPLAIVQRHRLAKVDEMLIEAPRRPIKEIAIACGWCDASHLARDFRRARGMTPQRFRELHQGS